MSARLPLALRLAFADIRYERATAACQVIGLAALLIPLLILLGIKNGVLAERTTALLPPRAGAAPDAGGVDAGDGEVQRRAVGLAGPGRQERGHAVAGCGA